MRFAELMCRTVRSVLVEADSSIPARTSGVRSTPPKAASGLPRGPDSEPAGRGVVVRERRDEAGTVHDPPPGMLPAVGEPRGHHVESREHRGRRIPERHASWRGHGMPFRGDRVEPASQRVTDLEGTGGRSWSRAQDRDVRSPDRPVRAVRMRDREDEAGSERPFREGGEDGPVARRVVDVGRSREGARHRRTDREVGVRRRLRAPRHPRRSGSPLRGRAGRGTTRASFVCQRGASRRSMGANGGSPRLAGAPNAPAWDCSPRRRRTACP